MHAAEGRAVSCFAKELFAPAQTGLSIDRRIDKTNKTKMSLSDRPGSAAARIA
jgi:hypothetical protein